jgi:hypothetical protein
LTAYLNFRLIGYIVSLNVEDVVRALDMMDLASSASCALKQEVLASDSYVGQNYGTSLLAEIPGIPLSKSVSNT